MQLLRSGQKAKEKSIKICLTARIFFAFNIICGLPTTLTAARLEMIRIMEQQKLDLLHVNSEDLSTKKMREPIFFVWHTFG
ncbi:hypothetical protein SBF1_4840003 [Candidatus Desulfosporosinus infrequens]|uniref:Uncharacterized protein n=1 Tax=Candidatus Desulfosporosinus infrequens TaxID=2043169 RepID=A0A2U3LFV7_9FIRM|nr:hypothetical protein SBF1_4840003 [Candidatus Desulfosporosinus infrequens]